LQAPITGTASCVLPPTEPTPSCLTWGFMLQAGVNQAELASTSSYLEPISCVRMVKAKKPKAKAHTCECECKQWVCGCAARVCQRVIGSHEWLCMLCSWNALCVQELPPADLTVKSLGCLCSKSGVTHLTGCASQAACNATMEDCMAHCCSNPAASILIAYCDITCSCLQFLA
jgi:hypothetical protein